VKRPCSGTVLSGVCVFRNVPPDFRRVDADAALPHAHALGLTAVATVSRIDTRAGVKRAEETGEVLPGVEVEAGPAK